MDEKDTTTATAATSITAHDEKSYSRAATPQTPSAGLEDDFVEGGLEAWVTVFGVLLTQFCGLGLSTSFGVYQDYYVRIYITNSSASTISWVGSINAAIVSIMGLFTGRLFDKGYFYHLTYGGALLISFSLWMLSLAKPDNFYQIFLTQGLGLGLGAGAMFVPSLAIISHHFKRRRALIMGLVAVGSSTGAIVHPILLNNTLNGKLGFTNATRLEAGLCSFLLIIACCTMKTKKSLERQTQQAPPMELGKSLKRFLKDKTYMIANAASFLYFLSYYFPIFYLQLDATTHGLSKKFAFYSLVVLSVCSLMGRLAASYLVHKFDVGVTVMIGTACSSIVIFGMIGIKSVASVVLIAVFYGFFAGMYIALLAPLYAALSEDMSEIGMRMGIGLSVSGFGVLIGPPIHGALLGDPYKLEWWKPALFSALAGLVGSGLYLIMNIRLWRKRRQQELLERSTPSPEQIEKGEIDPDMTLVD